MENLNIFSLLTILNASPVNSLEDIEKIVKSGYKKMILSGLYEAEARFWRNSWYSNIWHGDDGGFNSRDRIMILKINAKELHGQHVELINKLIFYKISYHNIETWKKYARMFKAIGILISSLSFIDSDIEFSKKYRKIETPWKTFNDFNELYILLCDPESLYTHLSQIDSGIIDKQTFLNQYDEYDKKPYSMRNMAKEILEKGEENYPKYSSEEALDVCIKLLRKALEFIPEESK